MKEERTKRTLNFLITFKHRIFSLFTLIVFVHGSMEELCFWFTLIMILILRTDLKFIDGNFYISNNEFFCFLITFTNKNQRPTTGEHK